MHGRPINGPGMLCAPLVAVLGTQVLNACKHLLEYAVCTTGSRGRLACAES